MDLSLIIASVLSGGTAIFSGFKAFSSVQEAHKSIRTRFGKAKRYKKGPNKGEVIIYGPGGTWMFPFVDKMNPVRMKGNITNYKDLSITLKNNLTYKFEAFITYDVIDETDWIYHVAFNLENFESTIGNQFLTAIQKILYKSEELDIKNAAARLKKEISPVAEENGFLIKDCEIMLFTETPTSQFLRGVDYRLAKAVEYQHILPSNILCAALGVNAVVTVDQWDDLTSDEEGEQAE